MQPDHGSGGVGGAFQLDGGEKLSHGAIIAWVEGVGLRDTGPASAFGRAVAAWRKSGSGLLPGLEGKNASFQVLNWPIALVEYA